MQKKLVGTILGVVALIVVVAGTTAAWFTWQSTTDTNVTFTVAGLDDAISTNMSASGTLSGTLTPVASKANGVIKSFKVEKDASLYADPVYLSFTLALTTFPSGLSHASLKWEFVSVSGTTETTLGSGNFAGKTQGDTIKLLTSPASRQTLNTTNNYKLYIWIDGTMDNPSTMQSATYKFTLTIDGTSEFTAGK